MQNTTCIPQAHHHQGLFPQQPVSRPMMRMRHDAPHGGREVDATSRHAG